MVKVFHNKPDLKKLKEKSIVVVLTIPLNRVLYSALVCCGIYENHDHGAILKD